MVIKVYISGMSGNKEVKKRQQRVTMIMESKHIEYTVIDITEPGQEAEKDFMQTNAQHKGCTISDPNPRHALPPQLFNDTEYCGDYDDFDMANEVDNLEVFLKLAAPAPEPEHKNGDESAPATAAAAEDEDENKENKTEDNGAAGDGAEATEDANEDEISSKLVDTDDPMMAEQEQEE
uniref:SH3 domain-binding glutamic acid-rich-like protein n=1 Tax=Anopheles funestus TaxID=62324 RepID=A0A4Y0BHL1_ANOFN